MSRFDYLIQKIHDAEFQHKPFKHVYLDKFFSDNDFTEIINAQEIQLAPVKSDQALFDTLFEQGYEIIKFPGCSTSSQDYMRWHKRRSGKIQNNSACEGFGMTLRLTKPSSGILTELATFLQSDEFNQALAEKFDIPLAECKRDSGIQKYLDGYEISPHPDVYRKALTFMVNINPHANAEAANHHTHYLRFKPEYQYVPVFWQHNPQFERCWVPWDWCESVKQQRANNSLVIFSPNAETMHAVKADYDHLAGQRTQLYGNLWYKDGKGVTDKQTREWEQVDLLQVHQPPTPGFTDVLKAALPESLKSRLRQIMGKDADNVTYRNY